MSRRQKKNLYRIIIATVLFTTVMFLPVNGWLKALLYILPYLIVGYDILWNALRNVFYGRVFDENFLMALATVGAFCIGEYPEAVFVMLFYQVGELFQNIAVGKSRRSITALLDIAPETARVLRDGEFVEVFPEEVAVGDIILVKPGEKIPLDGIVIKGETDIDTSNMTGESVPRFVKCGENIISGCVNISSPVEVKVVKEFSDSTVSKILELVEHSAMNKGKYENFITRFARVYTPVVVILALVLAFVPPVFVGNLNVWVLRALSFLVVSCPCALVISIPLSFFGGIGAASRHGALVKGSTYLELIAKAKIVVTDKTGTLTCGKLFVEKTEGRTDTLKIAKSLEIFSNHPVAKAICREEAEGFEAKNVCEISGKGITGEIMGKNIIVGNAFFMKENEIDIPFNEATVYVAEDGKYVGAVFVGDKVKVNAKESFCSLKKMGIEEIILLTGDNKKGTEIIAKEGLTDKIYHSLLPHEKVEKLEEIMKKRKVTIYLGDGVNDAPVLKRADVGIAMGELGSDAAIEASDIVFMNDNLSLLPESIRISKKTMNIVRQNIVFSICVKVLVLILSACGFAGMWQAVFADVGVMVIAVLNTLRTLRL